MPLIHRIVGLTLVSILFFLSAIPSAESPQQLSAQDDVLERFKVSSDKCHLLLPIELQGKQYPFILDTGSTRTVYDSSLRRFLGKPVRVTKVLTPGGDLSIQLFRSPTAKLGKLTLQTNSEVLCRDLGKMRKVCKEEIYGCLGMDFLSNHIFRIDFDHGEITFLQTAGYNTGEKVSVAFPRYNIPQIPVYIPDLQVCEWFIVDTGFTGIGNGDLRTELFDTLYKRSALTLAGQSRTETLSGSGMSRQGFVDMIYMGDFCHKKLLFGESRVSFLGLNYLSRYVVTFDFPNRLVYMKKGKQYSRTDRQK